MYNGDDIRWTQFRHDPNVIFSTFKFNNEDRWRERLILHEILVAKYARRRCECGREVSKFVQVKGRKSVECVCGKQVYPLKETIFERTRTPLIKWAFVFFARSPKTKSWPVAEVRKAIRVTYKSAERMVKLVDYSIKEKTIYTRPHADWGEPTLTYVSDKKLHKCY